MHKSGLLLTAAVLLVPSGTALRGQVAPAARSSWPADSSAVAAAAGRFLTAFENLDWEPFRASFAEDATAFFPTPEPPGRFVGRAAIEAQFTKVFAAIRASAPGGPPYQRLAPDDLRIDRLGQDVALVSFLLHNPQRIARRTLIFQRRDGAWRIVHLHASNVPVAP